MLPSDSSRETSHVVDDEGRTRAEPGESTAEANRGRRDPTRLSGWDPGATLGRYALLAVLGSGGLGIVYRARDPALDRDVAVKLLLMRALSAGIDLVRLQREAAALAQLAHPNVVAVFDLGRYGREGAGGAVGAYLVMELVEGETLAQWLQAPRSPAEILAVFAGAGRGLAAAHAAGIVHRDFKPANVIVGRDGVAKVLDFGLARRDDFVPDAASLDGTTADSLAGLGVLDTPLTQTGTVMGTPLTMAPEQHRGAATDARSDQYSFCLALAEALHGQRFLQGTTFSALLREKAALRLSPQTHRISGPLCRVLSRGLSMVPADRYETMDALLAALADHRRQRWWLPLGVGMGFAVAGVATAGLFAGGVPAQPPLTVEAGRTAQDQDDFVHPFATAAVLIKDTAGDVAVRHYTRAVRQYSQARGDLYLSACGWFWEAGSWDVVQDAATVVPLLITAFYEAQEAGNEFVAASAATDLAFAASTLGDPGWETWIRHALAVVERGALTPVEGAHVIGNCGLAYAAAGDMARAAALFETAVDEIEADEGSTSEALDWPLNNLAGALWRGGRLPEAAVWAERGLALRQQWHDPNAPEIGMAHWTLGNIWLDSGSPVEAVSQLEQAVGILAAHEPSEQLCGALQDLARAMAAMGRADGAIAMQERSLQLLGELGLSYMLTFVEGAMYLARWSAAAQRPQAARQAYQRVLAVDGQDDITRALQAQARDELAALAPG